MTLLGERTQHTREEAAAQRIYGLLPEDQGKWLYDLWEEFEAYETPEAKYAHMLDNSQPLFLNNATDGISWVEHGVKKVRFTHETAVLVREHQKSGNICRN